MTFRANLVHVDFDFRGWHSGDRRVRNGRSDHHRARIGVAVADRAAVARRSLRAGQAGPYGQLAGGHPVGGAD